MFVINLYDYYLPLQILGILIVLGLPLIIVAEIILIRLEKIKHTKIIFGIISIIYGSVIIIIAIWEDIGWNYYLENTEYVIMFDYTIVFIISIIIAVGLITRGIILIHKNKNRE